MRWRSITFRARAAEVPAVEKAIIDFVAKVADEPGTLRYESFRQADGVSYLRLMSFADDARKRRTRRRSTRRSCLPR
jgi:quinol monooxygenase YgiN